VDPLGYDTRLKIHSFITGTSRYKMLAFRKEEKIYENIYILLWW